MSQVQLSSNTLRLDPGHILQSPHPDQDHVMLLQVVALARDVGRQLSSIGESDQHALKISGGDWDISPMDCIPFYWHCWASWVS